MEIMWGFINGGWKIRKIRVVMKEYIIELMKSMILELRIIIKIMIIPFELVYVVLKGREGEGIRKVKRKMVILLEISGVVRLIIITLGVKKREDYPLLWMNIKESKMYRLLFSGLGVYIYMLIKRLMREVLTEESEWSLTLSWLLKGNYSNMTKIMIVLVILVMLLKLMDHMIFIGETIRRTREGRGLKEGRIRRVFTRVVIGYMLLISSIIYYWDKIINMV